MTEQEQMVEERFARFEREARRRDRVIGMLLGAYLAATLAFGGWIGIKVVDNSERITRVEARLDSVERRLDRIEARLDRIEAALNILVARKNGEAEGAGESKQSKLAPGQGKLGTEPGQLATR